MIFNSPLNLKTKGLSALAILAFSLGQLGAFSASALDSRVIDVVQVSWSGAGSPVGSIADVKNEIEMIVKPRWTELTTISGSTADRRIEFSYGLAVAETIVLTTPLPCERVVTAWGDVVREQTYKRLGISDNSSRYLVILAPENGCIWSGIALNSGARKLGGTLILHNTIKGFVIAHELGHLLGLGHSNLIRCPNSNPDGSWDSCRAIEYGGAIDLMSNVDVSTPLSTYHQWRMGLLEANEVTQSWATETVEINAVDVAGKARALFLRDGGSTYWIEYRRASGSQKAGLVIYRTDPPPGTAVISPIPTDAIQNVSTAVGTDIWMMNLDNYSYSNSQAAGSPSLVSGRKLVLGSGQVSLTPTVTSENSVSIAIDRSASKISVKPSLNLVKNWISPESLIIDSTYLSRVNAVAEYEGLIDGKEIILPTHSLGDWIPTYLSPFSEPKILRQRDLPEGIYSIQFRIKDFTGAVSPWSDSVQVNIDRGNPVVGKSLSIESYSNTAVGVKLLDAKDEGSGLCTTQLVNEEGWVISRSQEKNRPVLRIPSREVGRQTIKAFDCLGNGVASSVSGSISISKAADLKTRGEWVSAGRDFPSGSLRCVKSCSTYLLLRGSGGVVLGSGTAQVQVGSGAKKRVEASKNGATYRAFSVDTGASRKTVRVTGKGFVLVGIAQSKLAFGPTTNIERSPAYEDPTLSDPAQRALSQYGFSSEDFSSEWSILPMNRGTTLEDPTLDLCSGVFESEIGRRERRQVMAMKSESPYIFLSTETVRYRSKAAGEAAIKELKEKWRDCNRNGGGIEESGTFVKYSFQDIPASSAELVSEENLLVAHAAIGEGDSLRNLFAIYQFNGELFTGLYVVREGKTQFTKAELLRWFDVGSELATRLRSSASGA